MEVVLVDNGKSPDEAYSASLGFWLPPDSPYGNLSLKLLKICERVDEANRQLQRSWGLWEQCRAGGILQENVLQRHQYATEEAVYMLRRAADELVAMIWCLDEFENSGSYPVAIKVDCVGAALEGAQQARFAVFRDHAEMLQALNDAANAFKHSFVQSDAAALLGRDEPLAFVLSLGRNRLASGVEFGTVALSWLALQFSHFYADSLRQLSSFSERHR